MSNLQHERITVLAQDLRLTALPDLYAEMLSLAWQQARKAGAK